MCFARGVKEDYDNWEQLGASGWSYDNILKYFKKLEDASSINNDKTSRGMDGPLKLSYPYRTPMAQYFVDAGKELGEELVFMHLLRKK